jgi:superkiller protein 3
MTVIDGDVSKARFSRAARSLACLAGIASLSFVVAACSSSTSSGTLSPRQLLNAGLAAQGRSDLTTAQSDYHQILSEDPSNTQGLNKYAYYNLGVIDQQQRNTASASTNYHKAIQLDSKFVNALYNLAVLENTTNPTDAESLYHQILAISPNDINSNYNLGLLLYRSGQQSQGIPLLQKAIQLDPSLRAKLPAGINVP